MGSLKFLPTSEIKANLGIQNGGPVHKFFTSECAKAMDRYVPWRTGALAKTVILNGQPTENVKTDRIIYNQEYAIYPYYGITHGKPMNYRIDVHAEAGPYWDQRMWSVKKEDIIDRVQKYVDRGAK